jgi:NAD+ kinase
MQVAIYGGKVSKLNLPSFFRVFESVKSYGWSLLIEEELARSLTQKGGLVHSYEVFNSAKDLQSGVDLMISIGGDGTFLKSVTYIKESGVPILGVNTGRLGFFSQCFKR